MPAMNHLILLPILLPLLTAAIIIPIDERRRPIKAVISFLSTLFLVFIAMALIVVAKAEPDASSNAYLLGNWPAPFGIVFVLDRLSALMLLLTSVLGLATHIYSLARWHNAGQHFHTMLQLLFVGINGAFLTGDLFNLFVFFEVMLAASYGLMLHGSGPVRVKAGLHYIAINLAASFLFLIGVSLIYGSTGTLNMADLAVKITQIGPETRMMMEAGAAILGVAFLVKAGMWPLGFWLPPAYAAASPPAAAIFAILSKVGIYVILRLSLLLFSDQAGTSTGFGTWVLLLGGLATIVFGLVGVLASQAVPRLASYCLLISSGTLLAAIGLGNTAVIGGALFYLVSSTLAIGAFFLLIELVERGRDAGADVLAVTMEAYGDTDEDTVEEEIGVSIPATMAILGGCFCLVALLISGLPPFSGFIAKFAIMNGVFNPTGMGNSSHTLTVADWSYVTLVIISGLASMIALSRVGIRTFWASIEGTIPRVVLLEIVPVAALLAVCVGMTILAGPTMRYMEATARTLQRPELYIQQVIGLTPVASPTKGEAP